MALHFTRKELIQNLIAHPRIIRYLICIDISVVSVAIQHHFITDRIIYVEREAHHNMPLFANEK